MKLSYLRKIIDFISSSRAINGIFFLVFVLLMSGIISSQNFLFKSIVENGVSKRDVIATKTITVIDVEKTEQRRKEISQKIEPIMAPAEDDFIKNNLATLQNSIVKIRKKDVTKEVKKDELSLLFDVSESYKKDFVINYLLKVDDTVLQKVFDEANLTLVNVLSVGITENQFEQENIKKLITRNISGNIPKSQITLVCALLEQVIAPNLVVDEYATEMARRNAQSLIKPYEVTFNRGDKILFEGEPVTRLKKAALIKSGYNVIEVNYKGFLNIFVLVLLATFAFIKYLKVFEKQRLDLGQFVIVAVLSLFLALCAALDPPGFSSFVLPFPAFIIILSIFTSPRKAFVVATLILAVLSVVMDYSLQFVSSFMLINIVSMIAIARVKFSRRFDLVKIGFEIGFVSLIIVAMIYTLEKLVIDIDNMLILKDCGFVFVNSLLSGIISLGFLPVIESVFKIITPYGLAELADHNQPLLKRLQFEAPGTYHHSLMVSNLCEAACEAVGANPILARVGAFYHDIGKLKRPLFFVENQSYFGIENPHSKLNPRLSKMVITAHPKDGLELAKEYGLPSIIFNFIMQHHGEGLASYFYNQAIQEEGKENVKEEQFRYTGPKPNMKETAILMIADAVESAVRSLKTPTNEEIEEIIDKIIVERLNDGQLSDSPLTLKDIKIVATTFNRILRGMQHNRIKYHQDIVSEFDKNKIMPKKIIDKEFDEKIKELEKHSNGNVSEKNDED